MTSRITPWYFNRKIIGADTKGMSRELFLPFARAHGAILLRRHHLSPYRVLCGGADCFHHQMWAHKEGKLRA